MPAQLRQFGYGCLGSCFCCRGGGAVACNAARDIARLARVRVRAQAAVRPSRTPLPQSVFSYHEAMTKLKEARGGSKGRLLSNFYIESFRIAVRVGE